MNWSEWFYYDETSPTGLRWAVDRYSGRNYKVKTTTKGDVAGCLHLTRGYAEVKLLGKSYKNHRIIYELLVSKIPDEYDIDHKDRDRRNNSPDNLRLVKDKQNAQNRKMRLDNRYGITGVTKLVNSSTCSYWVARWYDEKDFAKVFRIETLGDDEAFQLACNYRIKMIQNLRDSGQHYTQQHGE